MAKKQTKKQKVEKEIFKTTDNRLDLSDIITLSSYTFNNVYDCRALLCVINKENSLHLTMDDVAFDEFDEKHAVIRAKNKEKYRGIKTVTYSEAKNRGYIV